MLSIKARAVIEAPITIVVIIKAWGRGSTISPIILPIIGMAPLLELPKFKNNNISAVSIILKHTMDLIIFRLVAIPYMPISMIIKDNTEFIF